MLLLTVEALTPNSYSFAFPGSFIKLNERQVWVLTVGTHPQKGKKTKQKTNWRHKLSIGNSNEFRMQSTPSYHDTHGWSASVYNVRLQVDWLDFRRTVDIIVFEIRGSFGAVEHLWWEATVDVIGQGTGF